MVADSAASLSRSSEGPAARRERGPRAAAPAAPRAAHRRGGTNAAITIAGAAVVALAAFLVAPARALANCGLSCTCIATSSSGQVDTATWPPPADKSIVQQCLPEPAQPPAPSGPAIYGAWLGLRYGNQVTVVSANAVMVGTDAEHPQSIPPKAQTPPPNRKKAEIVNQTKMVARDSALEVLNLDPQGVCRAEPGVGTTGVPTDLVASQQGTNQPDQNNSQLAQDTSQDPVNPANGEFWITREDLSFPSPGGRFAFVRGYGSRRDFNGPLGHAWDHDWNQTMVPSGVDGCAGEVIYAAGLGRSYSLEPVVETATEIVYKVVSDVRFTVRGKKTPSGTAYFVKSPDGRRLTFDPEGRLQRVEDASGYGFWVTWEAQVGAAPWRVATVTDDATPSPHVVSFHYDAQGRLTSVSEAQSGLTASYTYDGFGDLREVVDAMGRGESYEYLAPQPEDPAERVHIPEGRLQAACEAFCAPSGETCHSGKVCDHAADEFGPECQLGITTCTDACDKECRAAVGLDGHPVPKPIADECDEICDDGCAEACSPGNADYDGLCSALFFYPYGISPERSCREECAIQCFKVCDPEDPYCSAACNGDCQGSCEANYGLACLASSAKTCPIACKEECRNRCLTDGAIDCRNDCIVGRPATATAPAVEGCDPPGWAEACATTDWAGICRDGCFDHCVEESRGLFPGDIGGRFATYGYRSDLGHNIVRVYDGNHKLYLENIYGTDPRSPNFDAVRIQTMGDRTTTFAYRDLRAEAEQAIAPPSGGLEKLFVTPPGEYESVDVCPQTCLDAPFHSEPSVYVPWAGQLVELGSGQLGVIIASASLPPTLLSFDDDPEIGEVVLRAWAGPLPAYTTFTVKTPGAQLVTFTVDPGDRTRMRIEGPTSAIQSIRSSTPTGRLTAISEPQTGKLRVFIGAPRSLVHVAQGSCTAPFTATRNAAGQIDLLPSDACSANLLLAPLATIVDDPSYDIDYHRQGDEAFTALDLFAPSSLVGRRAALALRAVPASAGRYELSEGPRQGVAPASLGPAAYMVAKAAPALLAPQPEDFETLAKVPLTVFHVPNDQRPTSRADVPVGMLVDTGTELHFDVDGALDCATFGEARRGKGEDAPGAKATWATVTVDGYNVAWVHYFDEHGQNIRSVNTATGAIRSMSYNKYGDLLGVEEPLKDRTCARYDQDGNLTDVVHFPVPGAPGEQTPIRQRFAYQHNPSRLTAVFDPRDPTRVLEVYAYTTQGFLQTATDAFGQVTTYTYAAGSWGAPASIVTPGQTVTSFGYDSLTGLAEQVEVKDGKTNEVMAVSTSTHDAAGHVLSATSPFGATTTFAWTGPYLTAMSAIGDGANLTTTFNYDGNGQVIGSGDARRITSTAYDDFGFARRSQTMPFASGGGGPITVSCGHFGPNGRVLETISPEGERTKFSYDGEGRLEAVARGLYSPDPAAWDDDCPVKPPVIVVPPGGGTTAALTAALSGFISGEVARTVYDANGRPVALIDGRGATTTFAYDGFGRAIVVTDPDGDQERSGYDAMGNVVWTASYAQAGAAAVPYRAPLAGDAGLLAAAEMTYDQGGRPKSRALWHFDENGTLVGDGRSTTTLVYDPPKRRVIVIDDAGNATERRVDALGRPLSTTLPTGEVVTTSYAQSGRVITTHTPAPTDAGATDTRTTLSSWGLPLRTEVLANGQWPVVSETSYDAFLRPVVRLGPSGIPALADSARQRQTIVYDGLDRPVLTTTTFGDGSQESIAFVLDKNGRLLERKSQAQTGGAAAVTRFQYDPLDRVVRIDRPNDVWTTTSYVGASPLPDVTYDVRKVWTTFSYFPSGQVKRVGAGADVLAAWQYRDFVYDGLGRVVEARDSGAASAVTTDDIVTYLRWDSLGGKRKEWSSLFPSTTAASHVFDGRALATSSVLGGQTVQRKYDGLGRLTDLSLGGAVTPAVHFGFAGLGGPKSRAYGNGISTTFHYDPLGRLDGITDSKGGAQVARWAWALPLDGVPRTATFWRGSATPVSSVYSIDGGGRVLGEDHGVTTLSALTISASTNRLDANAQASTAFKQGKGVGPSGYGSGAPGTAWRQYILDGRNNWLGRTAGAAGLNVTPVLNLLDAYLTFGGAASYAADGSLKSAGADSYTYNHFNEIVEVKNAGWKKIYQYDALGRRVVETATPIVYVPPNPNLAGAEESAVAAAGAAPTDGDDEGAVPAEPGVAAAAGATSSAVGVVETKYLYDGAARFLRWQTGSAAPEITVDAGLDQHVVRISPDGTRHYFHQDRSSSVYLVTDNAGNPAEWYQYTAYGEMTVLGPTGTAISGTAIGNRFGFQGQPFDAQTGLVDMRARFYRPSWGRFVNPDPIGLAGGSNLYAFVGSAPTAWWDPMGTDRVNFLVAQCSDLVMSAIDRLPSGSASEGAADAQAYFDRQEAGANANGLLATISGSKRDAARQELVRGSDGAFAVDETTGWIYAVPPDTSGKSTEYQDAFNNRLIQLEAQAKESQALLEAGAILGLARGPRLPAPRAVRAAQGATAAPAAAPAAGPRVLGPDDLAQAGARPPAPALDGISGGAAAAKGAKFAPSPNQMNKAIKRGQAPEGIRRVDVGKVKGEQPHVHFEGGAALNVDGTWKHGSADLTEAQQKWLREHGWTLPSK